MRRLFLYILDRLIKLQFVRFVLVGGLATFIDFFILIFLVEVLSIHYLFSASFSFIVAGMVNFYLSKKWTFKNKNPEYGKQYAVFVVVGIIGLLLNNLILFYLVEYLDIYYIFGKVISTFIVMFWNFLMNKYMTFRK